MQFYKTNTKPKYRQHYKSAPLFMLQVLHCISSTLQSMKTALEYFAAKCKNQLTCTVYY